MKAIIFGCKYPQITPFFAELWNKYYSKDIEVIILTHHNMDLNKLPNNFTQYKLPGFTRSWVNDVSVFFDSFKEDIFFACMEDHFLYNHVQKNILDKAMNYMEKDSNIYKFGCRIGAVHQIPRWALDTPGIEFKKYDKDPDFMVPCPVKQSLMPSIWRTEFFKLLLRNSRDYTAWEFELRPKTVTAYELEPEITALIKTKDFLFYESPEPFPCIDLIRSGADNEPEWSRYVTPENAHIFYQARGLVF